MAKLARFTELVIVLLAAIGVADASTVSDPNQNSPAPRAAAPSRVAPLLDAEKSRRAIAAYGKSLALLCRSVQGGSAARLAKLKEAGFESDADASTLCASPAPRPIPLASGALLKAAADEILLQVPNGRAAAAGDQTLAILRDEGAGYRLVRHILSGRRFEARLRLTTPGGRDILLLCRQDGNMGLYPSTCGFLGQGEFGASAPNSAADDKNELHLIRVITCGPADSVILGDITLRADRLLVELIVERLVLEPNGSDEAPGGVLCSKRVSEAKERFIISYALVGKGLRRITPTPSQVAAVLSRY